MEKKISNSIIALYLSAIATTLWSFMAFLEIQQLNAGFELEPFTTPFTAIRFAFGPILFGVLTFFVAQELRKKTKWSWICAIALFVFNSVGFAFVFSIYGIVQLCDREVREYFLKQMDFNLN